MMRSNIGSYIAVSYRVQSAVGMQPSERGLQTTSRRPDLVSTSLPTAVVDAVESTLSFGHQTELLRSDQLERRRAIRSDQHVVIELQNMGVAEQRRTCLQTNIFCQNG